MATAKADTGAALCSVEVTVDRGTKGPPAMLCCGGMCSFAMHPSPVSLASRTLLLGRLSMVVGVEAGLNLVSCKH